MFSNSKGKEKNVVFGKLKGTVRVNGDLRIPIGEKWDVSKKNVVKKRNG